MDDTGTECPQAAMSTEAAERFLQMIRDGASAFEMLPGDYVDTCMPSKKATYLQAIGVLTRRSGIPTLPK